MTNLFLIIFEALLSFTAVVLIGKFLGKYGLIAWVAIATMLANILTTKSIDLCGLSVTMGTTLFASNFLATDILSEKFSKKDAKTAVYVGLVSSICLIVFTQIGLRYVPAEFDYVHDSLVTVFSLSLRISISSVIMYAVANLADVYIYNKLKVKMKNKKMWVRNNVATILCNCLENFLFMLGAFVFVFDFKTIMIMALSTSLIELILSVCDTPFLYWATHIIKGEQNS